MPTIAEVMATATEYHNAGRYEEAEHLYRQVYAAVPTFSDPIHLLGVLAHQTGRNDIAVDMIRRAIALDSRHSAYHVHLGMALVGLGRVEEGVASLEHGISLKDDESYAFNNLGNAYVTAGRINDAEAAFRRAIALAPNEALGYYNYALVLEKLNRPDEAIACYRKAVECDPNFIDAHNNLGERYRRNGRLEDATTCYHRALALNPSFAPALNNLALIHVERGKFHQAAAIFQRLLTLHPEYADGLTNYSHVLRNLGRVDEALSSLRRSLVLKGASPIAHSGLIFTLFFDPKMTGPAILDECRLWDRRHAAQYSAMPPINLPDPNRRLRLAYVSPDFHEHAAAYFMEPIIANHDRSRFEVFCYSELSRPDPLTARFKTLADQWRDTVGLTDEAVAQMIRADGIDIVVDCGGHSANNRLLALARKPAPIQVSAGFFGHGGTTGLTMMDYFLADPHLAPEGFESHFSETLVRMSKFFAPFRPNPEWPDVAPPPPPEQPVVFACFGEPARIGTEVIAAWRRLLDAVPGTRLLLKHKTYDDPAVRQTWRSSFAVGLGDRFDMEPLPGGWPANMDVYGRVSVMLDTFPVTGATSSIIPMWMGVPLVTMTGIHVGQRFGHTVLANAGLGDLIADTIDDYIAKAAALARDRERLVTLRQTLRASLRDGPICDEVGITREMEAAFLRMWRTWCAAHGRTD
ncbi:MAG: tetratricopeptide repeat protein [Alphaproteobacteria bacterium]